MLEFCLNANYWMSIDALCSTEFNAGYETTGSVDNFIVAEYNSMIVAI